MKFTIHDMRTPITGFTPGPFPLTVTMENTKQIRLVVEHGTLHTQHADIVDPLMKEWYSSDPVILFQYPTGDWDRVPWPMENEHRKMLASVLYGNREQGVIPHVPSVILPDGSEFFIDTELWD